jgi:hypothetical protein
MKYCARFTGEKASGELFRQFGTNAIRLPRELDFGDSYADVVPRSQTLGAVPAVVSSK